MLADIGKKRRTTIQLDEEDFQRIFISGNFIFLSTHKKPYVIVSRYTGMKDGKMQYWRNYLHREVLNVPKHLMVDHINGDRLDNRKSNLRLCTDKGNSRNKKAFSGKYKGVHFAKGSNRWVAQITKNYKCHHLGCFKSEDEAALAYNTAAKKLHGKYAFLNKIS